MLTGFTGHKRQGNVGVGVAISHFVKKDWTVCIPLTDSQGYDLIVEKGGMLRRIQIKTSRAVAPSGDYVVALKSSHTKKYARLDPNSYDALFVLTNDGREYLIPIDQMENRSSINVPGKYARFEVTENRPLEQLTHT